MRLDLTSRNVKIYRLFLRGVERKNIGRMLPVPLGYEAVKKIIQRFDRRALPRTTPDRRQQSRDIIAPLI